MADNGGARQDPAAHGESQYRIVVVGALDAAWSERLGGLALTCRVEASGRTVTELVGRLDSAALMGVLQRLHTYRVSLISLETLAEGSV